MQFVVKKEWKKEGSKLRKMQAVDKPFSFEKFYAAVDSEWLP